MQLAIYTLYKCITSSITRTIFHQYIFVLTFEQLVNTFLKLYSAGYNIIRIILCVCVCISLFLSIFTANESTVNLRYTRLYLCYDLIVLHASSSNITLRLLTIKFAYARAGSYCSDLVILVSRVAIEQLDEIGWENLYYIN